MILRLALSPRAEADLVDMWDHTAARWSPEQAERYLAGLGKTLRLLCEYPDIARQRSEFTPPVRLHPYRSHLVIFTADETTLDVIRVVSMRANWAALLRD